MDDFFINEYDGIEIVTIDKEEKNMIIRLDNIRKFYDEYCQMKLDKEELEERIDKAIEYINIQFDNNGIIHYELTKTLRGD